jgi:hypothetical protein
MLIWCTYIHVCHVLCSFVVMFTCTLVRSHPDSRGARCETWTIAINSKILVGRGNKMHAHRERPVWGSVLARKEAMKDVFARCFKKTAVQECTVIICNCCLIMSCIQVSCYYSCIQGYWFIILINVYFRRLKINHESHEFILESGTVANNYCSWQKGSGPASPSYPCE